MCPAPPWAKSWVPAGPSAGPGLGTGGSQRPAGARRSRPVARSRCRGRQVDALRYSAREREAAATQRPAWATRPHSPPARDPPASPGGVAGHTLSGCRDDAPAWHPLPPALGGGCRQHAASLSRVPCSVPAARSVGLGHGSRWRDQLFSLWFPPGRCVSGKRWALAPSPCTPRPSRKPFTSDALLNLPRAIAHGQRDGGRRIKPDEYFTPWSLLRLHALS